MNPGPKQAHTCSAVLRSCPPNPGRSEEGLALCRPPRPSGEQGGAEAMRSYSCSVTAPERVQVSLCVPKGTPGLTET